jgi:site-specific DNA-methyltransferase (adenine-specific)
MKIDLRLGDCLEVLKTIPDNSIDSVVTDPPYGLGFMNKEWDSPEKLRQLTQRESDRSAERKAEGKSPTDAPFSKSVPPGLAIKGAKEGKWFQEWCELWAIECLRILKPGGHILSFSAPRTYHRMATAFEDAGFEIRDQLMWVFGSGFPKSHNIGKAIDKIEGNDREVVGETKAGKTALGQNSGWNQHENRTEIEITKGNSDWEGWGTALKPAHEPIVMARKPLTEKSIAENVLKYGTGGINIDGSRVTIGEGDKTSAGHRTCNIFETEKISGGNGSPDYETHEGGRFPANIIFDEEAGQLLDEQSGISKSSKHKWEGDNNAPIYGKYEKGIREATYDDKGGASRFFYCPKTSKKDRNEGLIVEKEKNKRPIGVAFNNEDDLFQQGNGNNHPTVKPTDLMRYLINLITPPNGTTLDPFMGSGSTGKAAVRCGVNFIGIEKEQEYMDIASARIQHEQNKPLQTKLF